MCHRTADAQYQKSKHHTSVQTDMESFNLKLGKKSVKKNKKKMEG